LRALAAAANSTEDLAGSLEQLLALAQQAVPSCVAVTLLLDSESIPMTITASTSSSGPPVCSSLAIRIPSQDTAGRDAASPRLILYASEPGVFDPVARDLVALLDMHVRHAEIDAHLSIPDAEGDASELGARLDDRRAVDLALGILLDRGLLPLDGRAELQRLGQEHGTNHIDAARRLVSRARSEPFNERPPAAWE